MFMSRANLNDLQSFLIVAQEKSFTKAAAKLGVSQSALSHTVRQLEARLNLTLLIRTTRSVTPTSAGEYLIQNMAPHFDQIEKQLASIGELRNQPTGTIRITSTDDALAYVIRPKIKGFLQKYPGVKIELVSDLKLVDIFTEKFDAAIRLGENVTKEMASVPLTPDIRFTVVGSPEYFQNKPIPETPQDLLNHQCITIRLPTHGGIYAWEFEKAGRDIKIRVDGPLVFNSIFPIRNACLDGLGLAHMPEIMAQKYIEEGRLIPVLGDWCPYWSGYHLCFPHHYENIRPFSLFLEEMRYRPAPDNA
ncbi:LysR family transcriptional regulator [Zymomonas mobilis]|uniref:Transcriptional regulator, LysR family n=2 Tax=Zymomonas mobilis TaxID=542 RepID=A0A0H3G3J8_ZYMMA|nr:transcriptional regulator, LysR family [Zymomonas mobilis subsp. mobilis ATCC 10988]TQL27011.1 LysR family transcriptional regulator [Zymomonas mobilis]